MNDLHEDSVQEFSSTPGDICCEVDDRRSNNGWILYTKILFKNFAQFEARFEQRHMIIEHMTNEELKQNSHSGILFYWNEAWDLLRWSTNKKSMNITVKILFNCLVQSAVRFPKDSMYDHRETNEWFIPGLYSRSLRNSKQHLHSIK